MLAQNFKTAEELGIKQEELGALIKVLGMLERSELTYAPYDTRKRGAATAGFTGHFNMNAWHLPAECGTIACIGGTAELVGGFYFDLEVGSDLYCLFYPSREVWNCKYEEITIDQAARALRSYLTTGKAGWSNILE